MNLGGGFSGVGGFRHFIQFPTIRPIWLRASNLLRLLECQMKEIVIANGLFENTLFHTNEQKETFKK